eukprot:1694537-Amphidinium_carterae.1
MVRKEQQIIEYCEFLRFCQVSVTVLVGVAFSRSSYEVPVQARQYRRAFSLNYWRLFGGVDEHNYYIDVLKVGIVKAIILGTAPPPFPSHILRLPRGGRMNNSASIYELGLKAFSNILPKNST